MPRPDSTHRASQTRVAVKATGAVPRSFKPPRDRAVYSRSVPCPDCKAGIDQPCANLVTGVPVAKHPHRARRVMALRAERESQG